MSPQIFRIYFNKADGFIFYEVNVYNNTTVEEDISVFKILGERNRDTFDYLDLWHGQYQQDFAECASYRVNTETKTLEFSYPDPNEPGVEQPYQAPLSEKVATLESQAQTQEQAIADLTMYMATLGV